MIGYGVLGFTLLGLCWVGLDGAPPTKTGEQDGTWSEGYLDPYGVWIPGEWNAPYRALETTLQPTSSPATIPVNTQAVDEVAHDDAVPEREIVLVPSNVTEMEAPVQDGTLDSVEQDDVAVVMKPGADSTQQGNCSGQDGHDFEKISLARTTIAFALYNVLLGTAIGICQLIRCRKPAPPVPFKDYPPDVQEIPDVQETPIGFENIRLDDL